MELDAPYLDVLKDRITLDTVPFTERDSRIMVFREGDSLMVKLAEYETNLEDDPIIASWRLTGGDGAPLPCTFTTFPHRLDCHTPIGTLTLAFVDGETLLVKLPRARCGMTFNARADRAQTDERGGVLQKTTGLPCHVAYTSGADPLRNAVVAADGRAQAVHLEFEATGGRALAIAITRGDDPHRALPDPDAVLDQAARRWHAWFAAAPAVAEEFRRQYYYAWWVMAVNLIRPRFSPAREGMVPSKASLQYVGVWHWDAYFHALAYRHADMRLARDQIRIMLDHQLPNGMIPDVVHDDGVLAYTTDIVASAITKPPLTAWAAWKLYEIDGDREFLREIYEPAVRFHRWWLRECDVDGNGLCEYQHPYSSGLDNSPLWDWGLPVESPDLSAYLCLQCDYLSAIAAALDKPDEARDWASQAAALARRLIDLRWDEEAGLFWATRGGARLDTRTPFNLFPLITGRMPAPIASRLVATLTDPRQFWPRYPVPTVALDDPRHDPAAMWRGPVWLNVNYLLIDGMRRAGYPDLAVELRRRTLALALEGADLYEYYDPRTGEKPRRAVGSFGWTAALFIDLAIAASNEARAGEPWQGQ